MKSLKTYFLILIVFLSLNTNLKADEVKVSKGEINTINIILDYDFFTVIELENEVLEVVSLNTKSIQVQKLNNKSVLIYAYDNNLPQFLGKIIINDSSCNSYAISVFKGKQTKDQVIAISNSNKTRTCTSADKKGFDGFAAMGSTKILYTNEKSK